MSDDRLDEVRTIWPSLSFYKKFKFVWILTTVGKDIPLYKKYYLALGIFIELITGKLNPPSRDA